ncbi:MAG: hypothetical protein WC358_11270, partial [Ignavibacteria bacterium]
MEAVNIFSRLIKIFKRVKLLSGITKYGNDVVIKMLFITLIIDAIAYLINIEIIKISLFILSLLLFL